MDSEEENEALAAVDLENVNVTDEVACVASVSVANFDVLATRKLGREQNKKDGWRGRGEKETLADKPLEFENRPLVLSRLRALTEI